jgi:hypothetical protein
MAINTTASFEAGLSWTQVDDTGGNTADNIGFKRRVNFDNGTGNGQVDTVWLTTGTLAASASVQFDLYNLTRSLLGGTMSITFNPGNVKSLYVENVSTGNGQHFLYNSTGSNGFRGPSNGAGVSLPVFSSGALSFVNAVSGYPVNASNRYFDLRDGGLGSSYRIGIVGVST